MPHYPWQREKYWRESEKTFEDRVGLEDAHPLLYERQDTPEPRWISPLNTQVLPFFLPDHIVDGVTVFPGAGYVESALAAGFEMGYESACQLTDISFSRATVLGSQQENLALEINPVTNTFEVFSKSLSSEWTPLAEGVLSAIAPADSAPINLSKLQLHCTEELDVESIYKNLSERGLEYRDHFKRIQSAHLGDGKILARISSAQNGRLDDAYRLHPTLLDACFQSLICLLGDDVDEKAVFVPVGIDQVSFYAKPTESFWSILAFT